MRLIDAEKLIEKIEEIMNKCKRLEELFWFDGILSIIETTPTVDTEPVIHAHWIENKNPKGYHWYFTCSHCGYIDGNPFEKRYIVCPNCGAKMDEEKE